MTITSPSTLLCSVGTLESSKELLAKYRMGQLPSDFPVDKLWRAKQIKDAMEHPQTGKVIPAPFRMSAFMPANIILCYGLMLPNPSMGTLIFWQWANQSYNLVVNHANRNASNSLSNTQMGVAYAAAVTTSCSIAVGMTQLVKKGLVPSAFRHIVPYSAVASAGIANVFVMRWNEISQGITVQDKNGNDLGVSKQAGLISVSLAGASRAIWNIPCLMVPAFTMAMLKRNPKFLAAKRLHLPVELFTIAVSLTFGVPFAISLFPSDMEVEVEKLEPHFQGLKDANGEPIKKVHFHRGM